MKKATFGKGCFWHSEAFFGWQRGVKRTRVGYTGGTLSNPTYEYLGDHTEAVDIEYDPEKTSYKNLLDVFWKNHDPTELHIRRDRSVIFYRDEEEKSLAESMKKEMESKIGQKVVTDIEPSGKFFNAEDFHQKFYLQPHRSTLKDLGLKAHDFVDSELAAKLNGFIESPYTPAILVINKSLIMKKATFGMGYFWHSEAFFGWQRGVKRTRVGYTGGTLSNPTYEYLGDHTEAVDIEYDPEKTSYKNLLDVFWKNHDPTKLLNRRDRSVIFYRDDEEKSLAESMKKEMEKKIGQKVVTDIEPSGTFFNAEDFHQKFYLQHHHSKLFKTLGIKQHDLVDSELATKLNGYTLD